MKIQNAALFASITFTLASFASGCLDLKTTNTETTGGQEGGAGGESTSSGQAGAGQGGQGQAGAGQGGAGGGGPCATGETRPCYSGPPATQSKGTCTAGQQLCTQGIWSSCNGQVLPALEACNSNIDTNCDGRTGCKGTGISTDVFGKGKDDAINAVAIAKGTNGFDGVAYGVGYRDAVTSASGVPSGAKVLFVSRDPSGTTTDWSSKFSIGTGGHALAKGVALTSNGNVIVTGVYQDGSLMIGNQILPAAVGSLHGFFTIFDKLGTSLFAASLGNDGTVYVNDVVTDAADNIYIAGKYTGSVDFGGTTAPSTADFDGFVAAYSSSGDTRWVQLFTGNGEQSVETIAVDTSGKLYAGTTFVNVVNTPGGITITSDGSMDVLITALDTAQGSYLWNQQIGGTGEATITDIATSTTGVIALSVAYGGEVTLGAVSYTNMGASGTWDALVALLSVDGGALVRTKVFAAEGIQNVQSLAIDSFGDVVLAGLYSNQFPLDGFATLNAGPNEVNALLVKLDSNLDIHWGRGFGDSLNQAFLDVALEQTNGHILVGGAFQGVLSGLALTPLVSTGGYDALLGVVAN